MKISFTKVESSNLEKVAYDDTRRELIIKFKNSPNIYRYRQVGKRIYNKLLLLNDGRASVGIYFATNIKHKFTYYTTTK